MHFRHTAALAFAAIFMAVSCITTDKTVGDNLIPSDQDIQIHTADIEIPVGMKLAEPLQALSATEQIFGAIRTPEFGLAEFASAADICPNMSGWDFGKDPVIKDIYFLAPVSVKMVTEDKQAGIPQIISLHRTNRTIDSTTVLNNSFTAADYDHTPLNVSEFMYFGGDSIKMHLDMAFAEEILASSQNERDSLELFVENFKGILIKCSSPEEGTYGGRQNALAFGAASIFIKVDYQPTWGEGLNRKDTLFCLSVGFNQCLNVSSFESEALQTEAPGETIAFEGSAGLKPFISGSALKETIENWKEEMGYAGKNILIAKGAFVLPFEIPENLDMTKYPSNIYPCNKELDTTYNVNYMYLLGDCNVAGYSIGQLNRSLCEYNMDAPSYIQSLFSKKKDEVTESDDLWMMPIYSETDSYYGTTYYYIDDLSYYVGKINGPDAERKPKMRLVYSIVED